MATHTDPSNILVVDDTPTNLDIMREVLSPHYRVRLAKNGREALILSQKQLPDLILLDIMMPDMDGYEVCRRLKSNPMLADIPVIFVTAMSEQDDERKGFDVGAVDYITKPIRPAIVLARVKTHLSLHNQHVMLEAKVEQRTEELRQMQIMAIRCLGRASEFKDNETGLHVIRTSHYARAIALAHGISPKQANKIFDAMPMHDVGKIGIEDKVLRKAGPLDTTERANMEEHVHIGVSILGEYNSELMNYARQIAATHHEKWDGTGYPNQLKGEEIPLNGRIAAIADVFDALTSPRPYKDAWPIEDAVAFIHENAGSHFDPGLIPAFDSALPEILKARDKYLETFAE